MLSSSFTGLGLAYVRFVVHCDILSPSQYRQQDHIYLYVCTVPIMGAMTPLLVEDTQDNRDNQNAYLEETNSSACDMMTTIQVDGHDGDGQQEDIHTCMSVHTREYVCVFSLVCRQAKKKRTENECAFVPEKSMCGADDEQFHASQRIVRAENGDGGPPYTVNKLRTFFPIRRE